MDISKQQISNNNAQRNTRSWNYSLLKQRNSMQKNKQRQSMITERQASSIICIVVALCQSSGSSALIQSRTRSDLTKNHRSSTINTFLPNLSSAMTSTSTSVQSSITQPSFGFSRSSSSSSLNYRDYELSDDGETKQRLKQQKKLEPLQSPPKVQINDQHNDHHISNFFHTLWTARKTKRAVALHAMQVKEKEEEQKQYILDDYLESIDRRYKRLHEDDVKPCRKKNTNDKSTGGFTSALHWLTHHSDSSSCELEEQRKQEDALYVLGLADLASSRLLQRHHLPVPESKVNKSIAIDVGFKTDLVKDLDISIPANEHERQQSSLFVATAATSVATAIVHKVLIAIHTIRELGKLLTHGLKTFTSFLSSTSGSKQSLQAATVMGMTIFACSVSMIQSFTKA